MKSASVVTGPTVAAAAANLTPNSTVDVPVWAKGDAWTADAKNGQNTTRETFVVTAAAGDAYTLATDDPSLATYDALFDVSYVGKIRASDLAGAQGSTPVQFFSFPLADGKSWSTKWDGGTVNLTSAYAASIPTPLGPQPGFLITGEMKGKTYVTYDYVPALRWWSRIDFAAGYGLAVTGVAHNYTGQVATAKAKLLLTLAPVGPVTSTPGGTFTVDAGQSAVWLTVMGSGAPYARGLVITDPNGNVYPKSNPNYDMAPSGGAFLNEAMPPTPGDWRVAAPTANDPSGGWMVLIQEVAVAMHPA